MAPARAATRRGEGAGAEGPPPLAERLRLCRFLAQLPGDDIALLARHARCERFPAGAVLFRPGDAAERFYVVAAGHVALFLGEPGDLASIATIVGPGETVGEACVCGQHAYRVGAQTFGGSELIVIPGSLLCERLAARPATVLAMLSEMSMRLRHHLRQITDLKMKTTAQRLAGYLVGLTEAEAGPAQVRLPYEKKLLASHLGMQPETLSRAQMKLQALGVRYQKTANAFLVRDIAHLRAFASDGGEE